MALSEVQDLIAQGRYRDPILFNHQSMETEYIDALVKSRSELSADLKPLG